MDNYTLLRYDIQAKLRECVKSGYNDKLFNLTIDAIGEIIKISPNNEVKHKWLKYAKDFAEARKKYLEEEQRRREEIAATGADIEVVDAPVRGGDDIVVNSWSLERSCPLEKPEDNNTCGLCDTAGFATACKSIYQDTSMLVLGPFMADLVYQIREYAKSVNRAVRVIDLADVPESSRYTMVLAVESAYCNGAQDGILAFSNLQLLDGFDKAHQRRFCEMVKELRAESLLNKLQVFLLSSNPHYYFNDTYKRTLNINTSGAFNLFAPKSETTLHEIRLSLPPYRKVKNLLCRQFNLDDSQDKEMEYIRRHAYALGYVGLLRVLTQQLDEGADWKTLLEKIAEENIPAFVSYLELLGWDNRFGVLDEEWKYKPDKKTRSGIVTLTPEEQTYQLPHRPDLDTIDGEDTLKAQVAGLMNLESDIDKTPVSITARCGLVVTQALTGGDSMRNIQNLSDAEVEIILQGRWNIAYAALSQLMRVPHGEMVFDIEPKDTLGGQCCSGGQVIRMNKRYISNPDPDVLGDGCDTLLHELYHAVQYASIDALRANDGVAYSYYNKHFGITLERIRCWQRNNEHYVSSSNELSDDNGQNYEFYYNQVMEADARIFAADALSATENITFRIEE